jgi:hypothetical protein
MPLRKHWIIIARSKKLCTECFKGNCKMSPCKWMIDAGWQYSEEAPDLFSVQSKTDFLHSQFSRGTLED